MAEQDFDIKIRTTADTTGIRQTEAELEKLKAQAGAAGGPPGGGVEDVGAAASTMATSVTLAAGAGLALYNTIVGIAEEQLKVNEELDAQVDSLGKAAAKWRELAQSALTEKDIAGVTRAVLPQIEAISAKLEEIRKKEISGWAAVKDAIQGAFTTPAGAEAKRSPFEEQKQAAIKDQETLRQTAVNIANANIDAARRSEAAWEQLKLKPVGEAIAELTEKLRNLKQEQSEIDRSTAPGLELYNRQQQRIVEITDQLRTLNAEQKRQTSEATRQEEKKTRELERQTKEKERQRAADEKRALGQIGAAGSVAGAAVAQIEANRQAQIQEQRIAAEQRDLEDRRRRGAYGQTELGEAAFKGAKQDFGPGKAGGADEIVRAINRLIDLWK
jgi:chromosome segregation ATPase